MNSLTLFLPTKFLQRNLSGLQRYSWENFLSSRVRLLQTAGVGEAQIEKLKSP